MLHIWSLSLLTLVILLRTCTGCQDNCCDNSLNCCESTTCHQTKTCCQQTSCCQNKSSCGTQSNDCYRICDSGCKTQVCAIHCKRNCCENRDCPTPTTPSTKESTPTNPRTIIVYPPTPSTPGVIHDGGSNQNINNGSFQVTMGFTNNITNVNNLHIPINITSENHQNIQILPVPTPKPLAPYESTTGPTIIILGPPNSTPGTTTNTPDNSTTPSKVGCNITCSTLPPEPVPVPIPVYIPIYQTIPYPVRIPYVMPQQGCCHVFSPCISGLQWNCHPYQMQCGEQCTHTNMFTSFNPCINGCSRRQFGFIQSCYYFGYCQMGVRDCSTCGFDFYNSYNSYQQCGGCFQV